MFKAPTNWTITLDIKPTSIRAYDYDFWHKDCDGDNMLSGTGSSPEDCLDQIEDFELTHPYFNEEK